MLYLVRLSLSEAINENQTTHQSSAGVHGTITVVAAETLGTLSYGPFRGGLGSTVFVAFADTP